MCGNHRSDGTPVGHHHHGEVFHPVPWLPRQLRRRAFLGEVSKGTVALAVFSPVVLAACSSDSTQQSADPTTTTTTTSTTTRPADPTQPAAEDGPAPTPGLTWARTNHGFVSSYLLVRGSETAIVDTGVEGSADDIGASLAALGLSYADVRHVILTHHHADHAGSIDAVLAQSTNAVAYAGEADLDEISVETIVGMVGGEDVFGLEVLATPGHTDGHIAVIDHDSGLLVAGDALNSVDGGVAGPNPTFSSDLDVANESVRQLAQLSFNTLLVGHGDPIEDMADTAVAALAASL